MRTRLSLAAACVAAVAAVPLGALGSPACAAEAGPRAVLVVDTGDDGSLHRYCVSLPRGSVSGLDLIQLAGRQHGLTYEIGEGGAICMLAGVGSSRDDCFGRYPYFWGYWLGHGSGGWRWSDRGAGSTLVSDGDVQGWSWGRGDDDSTHPPPPPTTFRSVCPPAPAPPTRQRRTVPASQPASGGSRATQERSEAVADSAPARDERAKEEDAARARKRQPKARPARDHGAGRVNVTPPASAVAGPGTDPPSTGGGAIPAAATAALAGTIVLAIAGAVAMRRRVD